MPKQTVTQWRQRRRPISDNESKVTVPGIIVEDGKCDIGLCIKGSQTLTLDKLSFAKSEEEQNTFLKRRRNFKAYIHEKTGAANYYDENSRGRRLTHFKLWLKTALI